MNVDYSLYLVTDSTKNVLGGKDLATVVREAIEGGVVGSSGSLLTLLELFL